MHRSGTSAVAGCLERLGVCMGRRLAPGDEWNPRGYFEDGDLVELNDRLLTAHGIRWDSLDDGTSPDATVLQTHALEATGWLAEAFGHGSITWGFKDPRVCRLEKFWSGWFDAAGLSPRMVLVLRHPREIAHSLQRRDGLSLTRSIWLWVRHMEGALRWASRFPDATWIDFACLARNPESEMLGLAARLEIEVGFFQRMAIRDFIDSSFTHPPKGDYPPIPDWAIAAHEMLAEAAAGRLPIQDVLASADWQVNLDSSRRERESISQQFRDIFAGDTQLDRFEQHIRSMRLALEHAEQLAGERERGVISAHAQLRDTETALTEAARLAGDRLNELTSLDQQLRETQSALRRAETLANQRQYALARLDSQLGDTQSALEYAARLAQERHAVIVKLNAQLATTSEALAKAETLALDRLKELQRQAEDRSA
jgi:hypothetical protein